MYPNTTPKFPPIQGFSKHPRGFTLVEIMIVIVIILLLSQLGNVAGLFRTRDKSRIEELAVNITTFIDGEKVDALLGKTENGAIVRKRKLGIALDNSAHTISLTSEVNLASELEGIYNPDSKKEKTWTIERLEAEFYGCPSIDTPLDIDQLEVEFAGDTIRFVSDIIGDLPPHIIVLLKHDNVSHEVHLDYRTGLIYERNGIGKNESGEWPVFCN